ncbi:hypothetical protein Tsubulata_001544 [Turnera subulata]|uniref:CCHC-type domain-containing protein n=1 Tax=Turnera subulata TaxID=218843 RepID=A0A9Q0F8E4_9ROSI|nr:hypothetical protein Tsubulata_001544 [Turnera subulata]
MNMGVVFLKWFGIGAGGGLIITAGVMAYRWWTSRSEQRGRDQNKLYQLDILKEICNRIGRMIRVDYSTQKTERGRFTKVAVELDISTPLETEAYVDGIWYPIVYESLPQVCFNCGRAGHLMVNCPVVVIPTSAGPMAASQQTKSASAPGVFAPGSDAT